MDISKNGWKKLKNGDSPLWNEIVTAFSTKISVSMHRFSAFLHHQHWRVQKGIRTQEATISVMRHPTRTLLVRFQNGTTAGKRILVFKKLNLFIFQFLLHFHHNFWMLLVEIVVFCWVLLHIKEATLLASSLGNFLRAAIWKLWTLPKAGYLSSYQQLPSAPNQSIWT